MWIINSNFLSKMCNANIFEYKHLYIYKTRETWLKYTKLHYHVTCATTRVQGNSYLDKFSYIYIYIRSEKLK